MRRRQGLQLRELLWVMPLAVVGLAALHQAWLFAMLRHLAPAWHPWAQLAIYGLTGVVVGWFGLRWLAEATEQRDAAEEKLRQAYANLQRTHQQLLTLHRLGKRLAGANDVEEVLSVAARVPVEVLGARAASVVYFDPEQGRLNLQMTWGLSDMAAARLRQEVAEGLPSQACQRCQALSAHITEDCPLLNPIRPLATQEGIGAVACLPLTLGDERIGIISAYLAPGQRPSGEQAQALSIMGTEIASAIEGARLRSRLMATVHATNRLSPQGGDLPELLERALAISLQGWDADAGAVLLRDRQQDVWVVQAQQGLSGTLDDPDMETVLRLCWSAHRRSQPVVVSSSRGTHGFGSMAVTPLETDGEVLGALFLASRRPQHFTLRQQDLLLALGHQLALAARNAQLYHRVRELALVEERFRISREIHDGIAQTVGYFGLQAARLEKLLEQGRIDAARAEVHELRRAAREAYFDVREAIDGLRLGGEPPGDLAEQFRRLLDDLRERSGVAAHLAVEGTPVPLSPETELQLVRVVQEALTNVRKHAQARSVQLHVAYRQDGLELTISDDGKGFDPLQEPDRHHHGLAAMRERAQVIGAQLTLATALGRGTRVGLFVPYRQGPGPSNGRGETLTLPVAGSLRVAAAADRRHRGGAEAAGQ